MDIKFASFVEEGSEKYPIDRSKFKLEAEVFPSVVFWSQVR